MIWVSVPRLGRLNRGNNDDNQCTFSWVAPRGGLNGCGEDTTLFQSEFEPSTVKPKATPPPSNKMTSSKTDEPI